MLFSLKNKVCDLIRVKLHYVTKNGKFLNKKIIFYTNFFINYTNFMVSNNHIKEVTRRKYV